MFTDRLQNVNNLNGRLKRVNGLTGRMEYCSCDKIEKNEMGGVCSAYGGEERCVQCFGGET